MKYLLRGLFLNWESFWELPNSSIFLFLNSEELGWCVLFIYTLLSMADLYSCYSSESHWHPSSRRQETGHTSRAELLSTSINSCLRAMTSALRGTLMPAGTVGSLYSSYRFYKYYIRGTVTKTKLKRKLFLCRWRDLEPILVELWAF